MRISFVEIYHSVYDPVISEVRQARIREADLCCRLLCRFSITGKGSVFSGDNTGLANGIYMNHSFVYDEYLTREDCENGMAAIFTERLNQQLALLNSWSMKIMEFQNHFSLEVPQAKFYYDNSITDEIPQNMLQSARENVAAAISTSSAFDEVRFGLNSELSFQAISAMPAIEALQGRVGKIIR